MATGKSAKSSAGAKKVAKSAVKATKPTAKAAKPSKPAPKPAKAASKPAKEMKPVAMKAAAVKAAPKGSKVAEKAPAKGAAKPDLKLVKPTKGEPAKAAVKAPKKADVAAKSDKKSGKSGKADKTEQVTEEDFAGAEEFAADIASDMEAAEVEASAEAEPAPLTGSAALLAAMKPTQPDEKAAEKKKKKDDLKIDRNGDLEAQWQTLKDKNKAIKPVNYKMSESYESRIPILHKVLGWGFIINNQNDRLEVLFQQGIKFLISNYKA